MSKIEFALFFQLTMSHLEINEHTIYAPNIKNITTSSVPPIVTVNYKPDTKPDINLTFSTTLEAVKCYQSLCEFHAAYINNITIIINGNNVLLKNIIEIIERYVPAENLTYIDVKTDSTTYSKRFNNTKDAGNEYHRIKSSFGQN